MYFTQHIIYYYQQSFFFISGVLPIFYTTSHPKLLIHRSFRSVLPLKSHFWSSFLTRTSTDVPLLTSLNLLYVFLPIIRTPCRFSSHLDLSSFTTPFVIYYSLFLVCRSTLRWPCNTRLVSVLSFPKDTDDTTFIYCYLFPFWPLYSSLRKRCWTRSLLPPNLERSPSSDHSSLT